jgi:mRNA-degrading endonuclease HigB of HigAB toxin-antitoxin module
MELIGKPILIKLKAENRGNAILAKIIDKFIAAVEQAKWRTPADVKKERKDADFVHSDGFCFFDLKVHRTMILLEFPTAEQIAIHDDGQATVIWAGSHDEYESKFGNNKSTIERWLRQNGHIS